MIDAAVPFDAHRSTPLTAVAPFVDALRGGGLNCFWAWDELTGWYPQSLWTPDNTALAGMRDAHSTQDPFLLAAVAAAHDPGIDLRLTTDAIRAHPVDTLRRMLTLATATEGRAVLAVGVGEVRQTAPLGLDHREGLDRFEDAFRIWNLLLDHEEPVSYQGRRWSLDHASLGSFKPRRPEFWALGGGPRLLRIAAQYADGFETGVPASFTPERFAQQVVSLREQVESHDRDPAKFGFGVWLACAIHEDPDVIAQAMTNPIFKFYAAMYGRFNQAAWSDEGVQSVMPEGFHYATKYLPFRYPPAEVQRVVAEVSDEMVRRSVYAGSAAEIAAVCRGLRDAGASFIGLINILPLFTLATESPQAPMQRAFDCFSQLRSDPR